MKCIVSSNEEEVIVSTDGTTVEVFGGGSTFDIVKNIIYKRELRHQSEIDSFPDEYLIKNDRGMTELNTSSIEYLEEYLPKFAKSFGLEVVLVHE